MKTKRMVKGFLLWAILIWVMIPCFGHAIPQKMNYQGYLTSAAGVPINGTLSISFRIFNVPSGLGKPLWSETQDIVVNQGVYSVILGSVNPIDLLFDEPYYLAIRVGTDAEMTPRIPLTSVGYAFRAQTVENMGPGSGLNADLLDGQHASAFSTASHTHSGADITSGIIPESRIDGEITRDNEIMFIIRANDGAGSGVDADFLDGQHASAFASSAHNHDSVYVNEGQTNSITAGMIVSPLSLGGSAYSTGIISGTNNSNGGIGVYGRGTATGDVSNVGGSFWADGNRGTGVSGTALATGDVSNVGGSFWASGDRGFGVSSTAIGTYGVGVLGTTSGTFGAGISGTADGMGNATNYGGYFTARGDNGTGVYGHADATGDVSNVGGSFLASGGRGKGVYGRASGRLGTGVYGHADATGDASNFGGYFLVNNYNGIGVYAKGGLFKFDFYAGGSGTKYGPFSGGHEIKLSEDLTENIIPGMILSVTGKTEVRKRNDGTITLSSTLPTAKLSRVANDKRVFGVFAAEAPLNNGHWYEAREGERFATVNALGEGRVWVSNINGNVEVGDYITTSVVPGYGQRQDDDLLHNYTLGKATEAVDWDSVTDTVSLNGSTYKVYLIAVVYTSG